MLLRGRVYLRMLQAVRWMSVLTWLPSAALSATRSVRGRLTITIPQRLGYLPTLNDPLRWTS